MPLLIRFIAQRAFFLVLSSLTVLGLSPQADIGTTFEKDEVVFEEERKIIDEIKYPIPRINILNLPQVNITKPDDIKTSLPIIPEAPIKTPFIKITATPQVTETKQEPAPEQKPSSENIVNIKETAPDTSVISSIENVSVNILCTKQMSNKISLTVGSGVIISSSGVVLTNAHVAQHFLLKDAGYNCSIRRENIPLYGFNAVPLYISEGWIEDNHKQITNPSPTGTGKYDYALLLITSNTNPTIALPKFPSVKLNTSEKFLNAGDRITVAGYPGLVTYSLELAKNSSLQTDDVLVREIYTLETTSVDVVSTSDTNVAQRGSSGGGAFKNNELGGIIVSTKSGTGSGVFALNILTLDYINREIKNETGKTLSSFISGDLLKQAKDFETVGLRQAELLMKNL